MAKGKTGIVGMRTGRSLNLVLWFSFSIFAISLIAIYAFVQNVAMVRQYREAVARALTETGQQAVLLFESSDDPKTIAKQMIEDTNRQGMGFYVIYESGASALPDYTEQSDYPELAEVLERELADKDSALFNAGRGMGYGTRVKLSDRSCYLFLFLPTASFNEYAVNFRTMSVVTGGFSVLLAFIASGIMSLLITKPVTEVTEQAKELARGNYELNFKAEYFCSEMDELASALESARREISKADIMQRELIANVSHDFKTPLTMIKAYASMIREISGENKEKRDVHAQVIIDESDRLAALVGDLLDLSKLRAGMPDEEQSVFNLSQEVYRIAGRFDYLRETDGYSVDATVEEDLYTQASRGRIEQVLYNLIGNAVNYTGEDKIVRVKLHAKGKSARFEVIDSGKGIPPEEVDTIWDRYYRSGKSHKRPVQGTGLGLSIVKSILIRQEFPFGVVSEVGKGSCFWVEFPLVESTLTEFIGKEENGRE